VTATVVESNSQNRTPNRIAYIVLQPNPKKHGVESTISYSLWLWVFRNIRIWERCCGRLMGRIFPPIPAGNEFEAFWPRNIAFGDSIAFNWFFETKMENSCHIIGLVTQIFTTCNGRHLLLVTCWWWTIEALAYSRLISLKYSSSLFLKLLVEGDTTRLGSAFHSFTTRCEKTNFVFYHECNLQLHLRSFGGYSFLGVKIPKDEWNKHCMDLVNRLIPVLSAVAVLEFDHILEWDSSSRFSTLAKIALSWPRHRIVW